MKKISKEIKIKVSIETAYEKFLMEFNQWWPKEYTWSQEKLEEIRIDAKKNGLCTEIGPHGFRCDWGRVTEIKENNEIKLKWQIGPNREPVPNPAKASDIKVNFEKVGDSTIMRFEHFNFENHGGGFASYQEMMGSEQGWDHILNRFKNYCER